MIIHQALFIVFGLICVAGAVNLLVQRHPINSALSLVVLMASLAVEYLLLGAEFVAAVQVIVYAGAVMVLFVFVIMLLNAGVEEQTKGSRVAIVFGIPGMLLGAEFVAAVQVIVYAGAIMVLFVFVIMLLNAGVEEQTKGSRVAILFGIPGMLVGSLLIAWVVLKHSGTGDVAVGALPGAPNVIGQLLFHEFLLPFEVTSILILIAIMGAVVLASKPPVPGGASARKVQD